MDYHNALAISAAGMTAERTRIEVAVRNLAAANTAIAPGQSAFVLRAVVQAALPDETALQGPAFAGLVDRGLAGPTVHVAASPQAPRRAFDPGHPLADGAGFVSYPAVDPMAEMVTMMTASRAYEANVAAAAAVRAVALKALEIGS